MKTERNILLCLILFIITGCQARFDSDRLQVADSLLWSNPDSCIQYVEKHLENASSNKERKRLEFIHQHAYYKIYGVIENDTLLANMAETFLQRKEYRNAGEACYLMGIYHTSTGEYFEATSYLKQAEHLLKNSGCIHPNLLGMLYLNLGIASQESRLFDIALEYSEQALPFLLEGNNSIYIATCYHLMGKCSSDQETCLAYLDSALYYASQSEQKVFYKEIETTKLHVENPDTNSPQLIENYKYLCDSCQSYSYAAELAEYLILSHQYVAVSKYLDILALDTSINIWSKEQYFLLRAEWQRSQGKVEDAYQTIKKLHQNQTREIEGSAFSKTYIIAQKYDAAKEHEMLLQETIRKQRAYVWVMIATFVCMLIGGSAYYIHKRNQYKLKINEEQNKRLKQELEHHRLVLKTRIIERLEIAKQLQYWKSHHTETLPKDIDLLSSKQNRSNSKQWIDFYQEFDLCYNNLLHQLKLEHNTLTESDLQYIFLTYMGFSLTDICFLIGTTNRTIWNRRTIIKQHLGLDENQDLDEWIKTQLEA